MYINRKGNKTKTQVTESSSCCNMTHKNIPRKTWFLATGLRVGIFSHEMHYSTPPHTASSSMGGSTRSSLESPRETISGLVGRQAGGGLKHTSPPPSRPPPACPRLYRGQVGRQGGGLNLCFTTPPPSLPSFAPMSSLPSSLLRHHEILSSCPSSPSSCHRSITVCCRLVLFTLVRHQQAGRRLQAGRLGRRLAGVWQALSSRQAGVWQADRQTSMQRMRAASGEGLAVRWQPQQ